MVMERSLILTEHSLEATYRSLPIHLHGLPLGEIWISACSCKAFKETKCSTQKGSFPKVCSGSSIQARQYWMHGHPLIPIPVCQERSAATPTRMQGLLTVG